MALFGSGPRSNILQTVAPMYQGMVDAEKQKGLAMREAMGAFGKAIDPKTIGMRKFKQEFADADWTKPETFFRASKALAFDPPAAMDMAARGQQLQASMVPKTYAPTDLMQNARALYPKDPAKQKEWILQQTAKEVKPPSYSKPEVGRTQDGTKVMIRYKDNTDMEMRDNEGKWVSAPAGIVSATKTIVDERAPEAPSKVDIGQANIVLGAHEAANKAVGSLSKKEQVAVAQEMASRAEALRKDKANVGKDNNTLLRTALNQIVDEGKLVKEVGVTYDSWLWEPNAAVTTSLAPQEVEAVEPVSEDKSKTKEDAKKEAVVRAQSQTFLSAAESAEANYVSAGDWPENKVVTHKKTGQHYIVKNGYLQLIQ